MSKNNLPDEVTTLNSLNIADVPTNAYTLTVPDFAEVGGTKKVPVTPPGFGGIFFGSMTNLQRAEIFTTDNGTKIEGVVVYSTDDNCLAIHAENGWENIIGVVPGDPLFLYVIGGASGAAIVTAATAYEAVVANQVLGAMYFIKPYTSGGGNLTQYGILRVYNGTAWASIYPAATALPAATA